MFANPPVAQAPRSRLRRANNPAWALQAQRYNKYLTYTSRRERIVGGDVKFGLIFVGISAVDRRVCFFRNIRQGRSYLP